MHTTFGWVALWGYTYNINKTLVIIYLILIYVYANTVYTDQGTCEHRHSQRLQEENIDQEST